MSMRKITNEMVVGKYFRIRARHSGRYLEPIQLISDWGGPRRESTNHSRKELVVQRYNHNSVGENQKFLLFKLDDFHVCIAPKNSGLVLDVDNSQWPPPETFNRGRALITWDPTGTDNQAFGFIDVDAPYIRIQPKSTDKFLDVDSESSDQDAQIYQYFTKGNSHAQQFVLEEAGSVPIRPLKAPTGSVLGLGTGAVPRMTSFEQDLPGSAPTTPVLIGESYLPFIVVNDPSLTKQQQASNSPYYIMRREQFWHRDKEQRLGRGASSTYTVEIETGLTQETVKSLELTLNISFDAKLGVVYKALTGGLGGSLNGELKMTEKSTNVFTEKKKQEWVIKLGGEHEMRLAVWVLKDRYTLERQDGSQHSVWDINVRDHVVIDTFPPAPTESV